SAHSEGASGAEHRGERPPVQLRLRHEAKPSLREERNPERPRVEVRRMIRREDETALRKQLQTTRLEAKKPVNGGSGGETKESIHRRGPRHRRIIAPPLPSCPMSKLVIVESPAKARTIKNYLGPGFDVESSIGHIRDLPERAADIPAKYKKEPWARLGVDVENEIQPLYVIDADKKQRVAELKKRMEEADELLLATDEDREGEAIAWHLLEVLKPK